MLERHNYRCSLLGVLDSNRYEKLSRSEKAIEGGAGVEPVYCAHIIPHTLNSNIDDPNKVRFQLFSNSAVTLTLSFSHSTCPQSGLFSNDGVVSTVNN